MKISVSTLQSDPNTVYCPDLGTLSQLLGNLLPDTQMALSVSNSSEIDIELLNLVYGKMGESSELKIACVEGKGSQELARKLGLVGFDTKIGENGLVSRKKVWKSKKRKGGLKFKKKKGTKKEKIVEEESNPFENLGGGKAKVVDLEDMMEKDQLKKGEMAEGSINTYFIK